VRVRMRVCVVSLVCVRECFYNYVL